MSRWTEPAPVGVESVDALRHRYSTFATLGRSTVLTAVDGERLRRFARTVVRVDDLKGKLHVDVREKKLDVAAPRSVGNVIENIAGRVFDNDDKVLGV